MNKGGRTSTSWPAGSSWRHGKTTTIRVPTELALQILQYARAIDQGDISQGQEIILQALVRYVEWKTANYHPNQNAKTLNTGTRGWDELRKFRDLVIKEPEKLLAPMVRSANSDG